MVDTEDEAEIVGTPEPKRPSRPSHTGHTSNLSWQHSRPGPTPPSNDVEEEEEERPNDEEVEEAADSVVQRSKQSRFAQRARRLDRDWGRDHTKGSVRQVTRRELMETTDESLHPGVESLAIRSRSLSWVRGAPAEGGVEGGAGRKAGETAVGQAAAAGGGAKAAEVPPKPKSSFLFAQKTSLSALASQAKQILSNSAHGKGKNLREQRAAEGRKDKREENKIYITRPRPAREREKEREQRRERKEERGSRYPREVFPGVFLYQTGKTTRLVNLGAKSHARGVITRDRSRVSAHQLWPNAPPRDGRTLQRNTSVSTLNESPLKAADRPAGPRQKKAERVKSAPVDFPAKFKLPTAEPHQQDPDVPATTTPRSNSTENTPQSPARVTSYLRTSEITESHQQPEPNPGELDTNQDHPDRDPEPEPEEGEMSDYSYEEVEARPGWAEESINWQRTFSVNPMDFELLRSDWNDLRCNVSGNLQLAESEVVDVLAQYMEKLNERNGG